MSKSIKEYFKKLLWNYNYIVLREPKVESDVKHDQGIQEEVVKELKSNDFEIINFEINIEKYKQYLELARYFDYPTYYGGGKARNFSEKSLEHFIAAEMLSLSKDDNYVDIASAGAPTSEIYNKIYGCKSYQQDLIFAKGVHGNKIGGDASNMPLDDSFATKMGLHCSFEHFEQNSDMRFVKEAERVLKKGGKLCIVPLYLYNQYAIQTDLAELPWRLPNFEPDATIYCVKGYGNQYGRFYDVPHLVTRIRNNLKGLKMTIYVVQNAKDVDVSCYLKFIAILEKRKS